MNAIRFGTALVGALCVVGTALGQNNPLRSEDPYAVRLTRLDDQSAGNYAYDDYNAPAPSRIPARPINAPAVAQQAPQKPADTDAAIGGGSCNNSLEGTCWGSEVCVPSCCRENHWFAYVGGLTMGRDMPNKFWTTYDTANNANQLLYFPGADWGGGVDTRIGYWFGCGCGNDPTACSCCNNGCGCGRSGRVGVEAVYWGMWGLDGNASVESATNELGTVQDDGLVSFGGDPATDWFDQASRVDLHRNDEFHNVEVNFLWMPCCNPCNRFQMTALAGIRYFRFNEGLTWNQFGGNLLPGGGPDEAIVNTDVQNNLVGFQIGSYMTYCFHDRFSIFAIPKIGIFGNHITGLNRMALSDGTIATFDVGGDQLNFHNNKDVFSMMGSIDVGFNWGLNRTWSWIVGYRAVLATDMALGDNQIPQFFADEAGWRNIKTNGDLILHGAFTGLEARF